MRKGIFHTILLFLFFGSAIFAQGTEEDSLILSTLYIETGGENWINKEGWLTDNVQEWQGIEWEQGRVVSINLSSNNLTGTIPENLWSLQKLRTLDLSENSLTGPIPTIPAQNINLTHLYLDDNQLTSLIPESISQFPNMVELDVSSNSLSGELPPSIWTMAELEVLNLSNNSFEGEVPSDIIQLINLEALDISQNIFSGSLPQDMAQLQSLEVLKFENSGLCTFLTGEWLDYVNGLDSYESPEVCEAQQLAFIDFDLGIQTIESLIDLENQSINIIIPCDDTYTFSPSFLIVEGVQVLVDNELQVSGVTTQDFTNVVTYTIKDENDNSTEWTVMLEDNNPVESISLETQPNTSCNTPNGEAIVSQLTINSTSTDPTTSDFLIEWSDDGFSSILQTGDKLVNISGGEYQVRVTHLPTGCSSFESLIIQDNNDFFEINYTTNPQTDCEIANGSIEISSIVIGNDEIYLPNPNIMLDWGEYGAGPSVTQINANLYEVNISDIQSGCNYIHRIRVPSNVNANNISAEVENINTCTGELGSIAVDLNGNLNDYTYQWFKDQVASGQVISTSNQITELSRGFYTVLATRKNSECKLSASYRILEETSSIEPVLSATSNTNCLNPNGSIEVDLINFNGVPTTDLQPFEFQWSSSSSMDDDLSDSFTAEGLTAGTYYLVVTEGSTGCTSGANAIEVVENLVFPAYEISTLPNTTCDGQGNGSAQIVGLTGDFDIAWYEENGNNPLDDGNNLVLNELSSGSYRVEVSNPANKCVRTETFNITNDRPTLNLTASSTPNTNCDQPNGFVSVESIILDGNTVNNPSEFDIEWSRIESFEEILSTDLTVGELLPGDYYVRASLPDLNCFSDVISTQVGETLVPIQITLIDSSKDFPGEESTGSLTISIQNASSVNLTWYDGDEANGEVIGTSTLIENLQSGFYTVLAVDAISGCSQAATFQVSEIERLAQAISFSLPDSINDDQLPLDLLALSDQGLDISYEITLGNGTIASGQLIEADPGPIRIRAYNEGSDSFVSAETVVESFIIGNYDLTGSIVPATIQVNATAILFDESGMSISEKPVVNRAFTFESLREGKYFVLIDMEANPTYLDTYYPEAINFDDAEEIIVDTDTSIEIEIQEVINPNPGDGLVTGFLRDAQGGSRILNGRIANGEPLADIEILLLDETGMAIGLSNTDAEGFFEFQNIASGLYILKVNAPDLEDKIGDAFYYDETNGDLEITALIEEDGLSLEYEIVQITVVDTFSESIKIYPNPTSDYLIVDTSIPNIALLSLVDISGRTVQDLAMKNQQSIDVRNIPSGVYLLKIRASPKKVMHYRIIIQH